MNNNTSSTLPSTVWIAVGLPCHSAFLKDVRFALKNYQHFWYIYIYIWKFNYSNIQQCWPWALPVLSLLNNSIWSEFQSEIQRLGIPRNELLLLEALTPADLNSDSCWSKDCSEAWQPPHSYGWPTCGRSLMAGCCMLFITNYIYMCIMIGYCWLMAANKKR